MKGRVLIIDDNEDICEIIKFVLELHEFDATISTTGHGVLNLIELTEPDLIIMDVMLDGIDGRDICREIKQVDMMKHIPVILISASHYLKDTVKFNCHPDAFVSKPFDNDRFVECVEKLVFSWE